MGEIQTHYLYPAALFAHRDSYLVNTVLGSCVAICLHDPYLKIGGINHYMLPLWNGQGLASPKFGNIAIAKLIEKMISMGSRESHLIAKVFGGGNIFDSKLQQFQIGERNIAIAEQTLSEYNIKIAGSSTGGPLGRKIQFLTSTGEVRQKMIQKHSPEQNVVEKLACKAGINN